MRGYFYGAAMKWRLMERTSEAKKSHYERSIRLFTTTGYGNAKWHLREGCKAYMSPWSLDGGDSHATTRGTNISVGVRPPC